MSSGAAHNREGREEPAKSHEACMHEGERRRRWHNFLTQQLLRESPSERLHLADGRPAPAVARPALPAGGATRLRRAHQLRAAVVPQGAKSAGTAAGRSSACTRWSRCNLLCFLPVSAAAHLLHCTYSGLTPATWCSCFEVQPCINILVPAGACAHVVLPRRGGALSDMRSASDLILPADLGTDPTLQPDVG